MPRIFAVRRTAGRIVDVLTAAGLAAGNCHGSLDVKRTSGGAAGSSVSLRHGTYAGGLLRFNSSDAIKAAI